MVRVFNSDIFVYFICEQQFLILDVFGGGFLLLWANLEGAEGEKYVANLSNYTYGTSVTARVLFDHPVVAGDGLLSRQDYAIPFLHEFYALQH